MKRLSPSRVAFLIGKCEEAQREIHAVGLTPAQREREGWEAHMASPNRKHYGLDRHDRRARKDEVRRGR